MQKVHEGQDIISFYTILARSKMGGGLRHRRGIIVAIMSAFFITSFFLAAVNYMYSVVVGNNFPSSDTAGEVAYIPGTFVSDAVSKGYVGK